MKLYATVVPNAIRCWFLPSPHPKKNRLTWKGGRFIIARGHASKGMLSTNNSEYAIFEQKIHHTPASSID
jgi:hypothetical protein